MIFCAHSPVPIPVKRNTFQIPSASFRFKGFFAEAWNITSQGPSHPRSVIKAAFLSLHTFLCQWALKCWTSQASRSIRIAWLLEELGLDYMLHTWDHESSGLAPAESKQFLRDPSGEGPRAQRRALDSSGERCYH